MGGNVEVGERESVEEERERVEEDWESQIERWDRGPLANLCLIPASIE